MTGLSDYQIIGLSDYRIIGLSDYQIIRLSDYHNIRYIDIIHSSLTTLRMVVVPINKPVSHDRNRTVSDKNGIDQFVSNRFLDIWKILCKFIAHIALPFASFG